jgi:hypothetical protein
MPGSLFLKRLPWLPVAGMDNPGSGDKTKVTLRQSKIKGGQQQVVLWFCGTAF